MYIDIEELRPLIVEILRDPDYMHNDAIRGVDGRGNDIRYDLIGVIVGMYEMIHRMTYNKSYDYMFHWANKCGSWVETDYLKNVIDIREGREEDGTL